MITKDKVIEIFCIIDEFDKNLNAVPTKDGKGTMGWCHGFKLHLLCNDCGEVITFGLTGANVDDMNERVWRIRDN